MPAYEYETTTAIIKLGKYTFVAKGKVDVSLGWKALYREEKQESKLPPLKIGEKVRKEKVFAEEKKTQPPPRYTEGKLLKVMEKLGLGTPATRAQIIETLKKRGYVYVSKKALIPTAKAFALLKALQNSKVASPEMTVEWEKKLESIYTKRLGFRGYKKFLEGIKKFVKGEVESLKNKEEIKKEKEEKENKKENKRELKNL